MVSRGNFRVAAKTGRPSGAISKLRRPRWFFIAVIRHLGRPFNAVVIVVRLGRSPYFSWFAWSLEKEGENKYEGESGSVFHERERGTH